MVVRAAGSDGVDSGQNCCGSLTNRFMRSLKHTKRRSNKIYNSELTITKI